MKARTIAIGVAALLCIVLNSTLLAEQTITLTGDPWPPYVIGEVGSDATAGTGLQLIEEIFARIDGTSMRFPLLPWNRALIAAEQGAMDGIAILLKTQEREKYLLYTNPLFTSYDLVWYSTGRFPDGFVWNTIDDLTPFTIGVVDGYSYSDQIDAAIEDKRLSVVRVSSAQQLITMLAGGRIDIAFANNSVGCSLARQHTGPSRVLAANKEVAAETYYLGFSRKSPAVSVVPRVNRVIAELNEQGRINQILHAGRTDCIF